MEDPTDPDVLPGEVPGSFDWGPVNEVLDSSEQLAAALRDILDNTINGRLDEAAAVADSTAAILNGAILEHLNKAETTLAKTESKILGEVQSRLDDAYFHGAQINIPVPSPDQVMYGLQTGDYLGSVGLTPAVAQQPAAGQIAQPGASYDAGRLPAGSVPGGSGDDAIFPATPGVLASVSNLTPPTPLPGGYASHGNDPAVCLNLRPRWDNIVERSSPGYWEGNVAGGLILDQGALATSGGTAVDGREWKAYAFTVLDESGQATMRWYYAPVDSFIVSFQWPESNIGKIGWKTSCPLIGQCWFNESGSEPTTCGAGGTGTTTPPPPPPPPGNPPPPPPGNPPPDTVTGGGGDQCPIPPRPDCTKPMPVYKPNILPGDPCDMVAFFGAAAPNGKSFLESAFAWGFGGGGKSGIVGDIVEALTGSKRNFFTGMLDGFRHLVGNVVDWIVPNVTVDKQTKQLSDAAYLTLGYNFFQKWAGLEIPQWSEELRHRMNSAEPWKMPGGIDATVLYLADQINRDQWRCFQQLDGIVVQWAEKMVQANRNRPNQHEVVEAFRRNFIDVDDYDKRSRENGVLDAYDKMVFRRLQEAQPGLEDVMRFMVRDVASEEVVTDLKLDTDFEKNWTGQLRVFGDQLGVTEELAQYYWRAHWRQPSLTQAFEMLHRNRPGRVDADDVVLKADVERLLKIDDMLPYWIPKLTAASYRTIDKAGAKAGYKAGVFKAQDLVEIYQDQGYNLRDATLWKDVVVAQVGKQKAAELGGVTAKQWMTAFSRREISEGEFREELTQLGYDQFDRDRFVERAVKMRALADRKALIATVKRRFTKGLMSNSAAQMALSAGGLDHDQIMNLMNNWEFVVKTKGKELSAAQLCQFTDSGLITAEAQRAGLMQLGYNRAQAELIAGQCEQKITERQIKAAEKAAREAAAAVEKARKRAISDWDRENKNRKIRGEDPLPYPDLP